MRDDFDKQTKETLAKRVAWRCSNPKCRRHTSGPQTDPDKAINVGVAAHICAAAPGGKRYDPGMSSKQRKAITNGIWLCQHCAKLIDSDEQRYTVDLLTGWKQSAENSALQEIENLIVIDVETIEEQPNNAQDVIGYVIFGVKEPSALPWYNLFGDSAPRVDADSFEEVIFDDINEMSEVFGALNKVVSTAKEYELRGTSSTDAFERALKEEAISRVEQLLSTDSPQAQSTENPHVGYIVWGVKPEQAAMIRVLRPRAMFENTATIQRNYPEVVFQNVYTVLKIPDTINTALKEAQGDQNKFMQLLFRAVLRLRLLGPE